jgi:hypothetical protein
MSTRQSEAAAHIGPLKQTWGPNKESPAPGVCRGSNVPPWMGQRDAGVSTLTGSAIAHRATLSTTKGYSVQRDFTFEPKVFSELKNAQANYDGLNPHPPSFCYLKPYYLDQNISYFEQLAKGAI